MGTVIVAAVLVVIVGMIIRTMVRDRRLGKSPACGGDCSRCKGHCGN